MGCFAAGKVTCAEGLGYRSFHFPQTPLQKAPLTVVGNQLQSPAITLRSVLGGTQAAQEIGARGMQEVIILEVTGSDHRVDDFQRCPRSISHGDGNAAVERNNRRWLQA